MGLPYNKLTDVKCLRCSKFEKFDRPKGVLDQVDPKFDVDSNVDCLGDRWVFLTTNLLTKNVSGVVSSRSSSS